MKSVLIRNISLVEMDLTAKKKKKKKKKKENSDYKLKRSIV